MEFDELRAVAFINDRLREAGRKPYPEDEVLNVIDMIWDFYEENGLLDVDAADDDTDDDIEPDTDLVTIDGISDERHAATLTNKTVYILRSDIPEESTDDSGDGFYADDFVGFDVRISGMGLLGKISGIEDSTANYLFIIETTDGRNLLIPVADEFVTGIDTDSRSIEMDLPEGLIDIQ